MLNSETKLSLFKAAIVTKNFLNVAYFLGVRLSKTLDMSKIHSLLERYQVTNQRMQKDITSVIENNPKLQEKIKQLADSDCDCKNDNTKGWSYSIICWLLFPLFLFSLLLYVTGAAPYFIFFVDAIGDIFNCFWAIIG